MKVLAIIVAALVAAWLFTRYAVTGASASLESDPQFAGSVPSGSGRLSFSDIQNLWIKYGGDITKAPMAAAIALAESGGDPGAYNGSDPHGGSFGLFQINGVHGDAAAYDIPTNVKAAIDLSNNGQNWKPWGAFTNGSYEQYATGG